MGRNILVIGNSNSLGRELGKALHKQGDRVFSTELAGNTSNVEPLAINPTLSETITPANLEQVQQIIFCLEPDHNTPENFGNSGFTFKQLENLLKRSHYLGDNSSLSLFDFSVSNSEQARLWGAVNDGVMGGVSQSQLQLKSDKAIFTGIVSTANNGGFASVRSQNYQPPLDLGEYQGIELKVTGDGKRYKFITRCEGAWDGVSYCASFDTVYNLATTVRIPFAQLRPVVRAKTYTPAGKFNPAQLYSLQLMLSKFEYDGELNATFEPGEFSLEIASISAYGGAAKPKLVVINSGANETLEKTLYNSELPYVLVRDRPITQINPSKTFYAPSTNLITLALEAANSPEALQQLWLLD